MKSEKKCGTPWGMAHRDVTFDSDGFRLSGTLHLPGTGDPPVVVGSHGLLSSSDSPKQRALADECARIGMVYFRFDHRGCGGSEGDFEKETSLESRCRDMLHAVDFLKSQGLSCHRLGLFGSSMGGAVCISVAATLSFNVMVVNAAPVKLDRIRSVPGISGKLSSSIGFDLSGNLKQLHHILAFHGDADDVVPADNAHLIYEQAREPKRLTLFQHGDHAMSDPDHQERFVRESVRWFGKHIF